MKPIVKLCAAASGILFLLGLLCIGAGAAMGMTPGKLIESAHYPGSSLLRREFRYRAADRLDVTLDDLDDALDGLSPLAGDNATGAEEYYEFQDVAELKLELSLCRLEIRQHEAGHVALGVDNAGNTFRYSQKGDSLLIEDKRSTPPNQFDRNQALHLTLYLPEQGCREVSVELGVGDITIGRLAADDIEIDNGVGDITAGTLSGKEISLMAGVGNLTVDSILAEKKAELEVGTGDLTVAQYNGKSLELECGVGNAEVTAVGREPDYSYTLDAGLGSVCLNQQLYENGGHHDSHHGSQDHHLDIRHDTDRHISMDCGLGNAILNFMEE